jgi:hypothetical protein
VDAVTRHSFGGGIADYVVSRGTNGELLLAGNAPVTFWDAPSSGTKYIALVDGSGAPIPDGVVMSDSNGAIPAFGQGPEGVRVMWASADLAGEGPRRLMHATDSAAELADLQARLAALEGRLAGVGRITVAPTAPESPAIGDVWLDTAPRTGSEPVTFRAGNGLYSASAPSVTCPLPGGLVAGDYVIAVIAMEAGAGQTISAAPAGWTTLVPPDLTGGDTRVGVYGKGYAPGDAAPVWTYSASTKATVIVAGYAGADPEVQVGTVWARPTAGTTVIDAPSLTTTQSDMLIVCAYGEKSLGATAITDPAGAIRRVVQFGTGTVTVPSAMICDFAQPAPGATGTRTATYDTSSNNGLGVQIGLRRRQI